VYRLTYENVESKTHFNLKAKNEAELKYKQTFIKTSKFNARFCAFNKTASASRDFVPPTPYTWLRPGCASEPHYWGISSPGRLLWSTNKRLYYTLSLLVSLRC